MLKARKRRNDKPSDQMMNTPAPTFDPRVYWFAAILFIFAFITYIPVLNHTFHSWDDQVYITSNDRVLQGLTADNVKWAFSTTYFGFYYPLTWLSHMADVQFFGTDPRGHYLTSILLHSINAVLLFFLVMLVSRSPLKSAAIAALFAVHPMNVESVAWLAERKNLLSSFFLLVSLIFYLLRYDARTKEGIRPWHTASYYASYILGIMSKTSIVMFPVLLLLADYWPLGRYEIDLKNIKNTVRGLKALIVEKIPLFLISLVSGMVTIFTQREIGAMNALSSVSIGQRVGEAFLGLGFYLYKLILPFNLCALYVHHKGEYSAAIPLLIAAGLSVATILFFILRKSAPVLITGWMFFLVSLIPVLGLIQVGAQAYADRYVYFPYWGLFAAIVLGIPWGKLIAESAFRKVIVGSLFFSVIVTFFITSRFQMATWRDDQALFGNIIKVSPKAMMAYVQLGNVYGGKGEVERSDSLYKTALELCEAELVDDPSHSAAYFNKASVLFNLRRYEEALEYFKLALERGHDEKKVAENMKAAKAMILKEAFDEGKQAVDRESWAEAEMDFKKAVEIDPGKAELWSYLGYTLEREGKDEEAKQSYRKAILLNPSFDVETYNLALLEIKTDELDKAGERLAALERLNSPHAQKLRELLSQP